MKRKRFLFPLLIAILFILLPASAASADSFTVTGGGTSPIPPDDILLPGPVPILIGVAPPTEVDAFSFGHIGVGPGSVTVVEFSVDLLSVGALGSAVIAESGLAPAEPGADIFSAVIGSGTNVIVWDGNGTSAPTLGLVELAAPGDEVDGFDKGIAPALGHIWWSVDPLTAVAHPAYGGGLGFSPADVYVAFVGGVAPPYAGVPAPYAPAPALGLDTFGFATDDIDALVVLEDGVTVGGPMTAGDCVLFSLAPGSATLAPLGAGPEDVLASGLGCPGPFVIIAGATIGLVPNDNLDALDIIITPTAVNLQEAQLDAATTSRFVPIVFLGMLVATFGLKAVRRPD